MKKIDRNVGNLVMCIAEAVIGILLLVNPVGFTSGIIIALGIVLASQLPLCFGRSLPLP